MGVFVASFKRRDDSSTGVSSQPLNAKGKGARNVKFASFPALCSQLCGYSSSVRSSPRVRARELGVRFSDHLSKILVGERRSQRLRSWYTSFSITMQSW